MERFGLHLTFRYYISPRFPKNTLLQRCESIRLTRSVSEQWFCGTIHETKPVGTCVDVQHFAIALFLQATAPFLFDLQFEHLLNSIFEPIFRLCLQRVLRRFRVCAQSSSLLWKIYVASWWVQE